MAKFNTNLSFILKVFSLLAILMVGLINRDSPEDQLKSENLIEVDSNIEADHMPEPNQNS